MPDGRASIVVDASVAGQAGVTGDDGVLVVRAGDRRGGRIETAAEVVAAAPADALVLARPPWADPFSAALAGLALLRGRDLVWLPPGLPEAGWATALIATWATDVRGSDLVRRAQVAVGLAALPACRLPRRPWGCDGSPMPALVADSLARWCDRLWEPCGHCAVGGGAPGTPCGHCGHCEVSA